MSFDVSKFVANMTGEGQARARAAAVRAVDLYGEHVIGKAQDKAPLDIGNLKDSGTTLPAEMAGNKVVKVIGFNTNYAAVQHERTDFKHPKGGEAKYLEKAMRQEQHKLATFLEKEINKAL